MTPSKLAVVLVFALCVATPARATPFGVSWDGNPPGTLANLTGIAEGQFTLGHPLFEAGHWLLFVDGGYAGWRDLDTVCALGTDGQSLTLVPPGPLALSSLTFTMTAPWALWGTSPSLTAPALSTGSQWAFAVVGDTLRWGWEDIAIDGGDRDYQDLYGRLERVPADARGAPVPPVTPDAPVPVPEPATVALVGVGLLLFAARYRQ